MINITFTGSPPIYYQQDNNWNQPSFTGAVQWNGQMKRLEVTNGEYWHPINNTINFHSNIDMHIVAQWVMKKMAEEEKEKELRSKYPMLDQAYKDLEFIKRLIADDI